MDYHMGDNPHCSPISTLLSQLTNMGITMSSYLELSSRIQSLRSGNGAKGGSCNTFVLQDTVESIAEFYQWAMMVSKFEGAPTGIFSNLRGKDSMVSGGFKSSGPVSFLKPFDEITGAMKRREKKNGVGVAFLDITHPDILDWVSQGTAQFCNHIFLGVLIDPKEYKNVSDEVKVAVAKAYNEHRIFINKYGFHHKTGERLYPNVCNEIRQHHKGVCTLAAIKLFDMAKLDAVKFATVFRDCATTLINVLPEIQLQCEENPNLYTFEKQVGLGFVGMANLIGSSGTTYHDMAVRGEQMLKMFGDEEIDPLDFVLSTTPQDCPDLLLWSKLVSGILAASVVQHDNGVARMFTSQPTAHTSLRLTDNSNKAVAAELAPPRATRLSNGSSQRINQSDTRGNTKQVFANYVELQDEVPYETYYKFCDVFAGIIDYIVGDNQSHTFSHCFYGEEFTREFMDKFVKGNLGSMYYRLPSHKSSSDKTKTLDDAGELSFEDEDEEEIACGLKMNECESCSM